MNLKANMIMNIIKTHTIINPNLYLLDNDFLSPNILQHCLPEALIEWAARLCYVSNNKFGSSNKFIPGIIKAKHLDVLEHVSLCCELPFVEDVADRFYWYYIVKNKFPYLNIKLSYKSATIWANLRAWKEVADTVFDDFYDMFTTKDITDLWFYLSFIAPHVFGLQELRDSWQSSAFEELYGVAQNRYLQISQTPHNYIFDRDKAIDTTPTNANVMLLGYTPVSTDDPYYHATFQFSNISRNACNQLTRHRILSHSQQSLRYCDTRNSKFIVPSVGHIYGYKMKEQYNSCMKLYEEMRDDGIKKEDARAIIPNNIETHIVTSGFSDGWKHFFELRTAKDAQEEIRFDAIAAKKLLGRIGE
jgi:hypothetical protein